jgi:hypothetical protein
VGLAPVLRCRAAGCGLARRLSRGKDKTAGRALLAETVDPNVFRGLYFYIECLSKNSRCQQPTVNNLSPLVVNSPWQLQLQLRGFPKLNFNK